jgi:ribosomal-protein-alanine N-acetyltransferase
MAFTPDNFSFRPMAQEDVALFAAWEQAGRPYPWSHQTFNEALLFGCPTKIFVLDDGRAAVGFAAVHRAADEAYLSNFVVAPTLRRGGLGENLLQRVMIWCKHSGASQLFLDVDPANLPAIALYNKHGFETIERRPRSYPRGEDAIVMRKKL